MDLDNIFQLLEVSTKDTGKKTNVMEKENRLGQTELYSKVNMNKIKNLAMENSFILMEILILVR